jgi:hypothetical protein
MRDEEFESVKKAETRAWLGFIKQKYEKGAFMKPFEGPEVIPLIAVTVKSKDF